MHDLWGFVREVVIDGFGQPGFMVVLLMIVATIFLILFQLNWSFRKKPFVDRVLRRIFSKNIPEANPARISILLFQLDGDVNNSMQNTIADDLGTLENVQILKLYRQIQVFDEDVKRLEQAGHDLARETLVKAGANLAIWGTLLSPADRTKPCLYWTPADANSAIDNHYAMIGEASRLPELAWDDLRNILHTKIYSEAIYVEHLDDSESGNSESARGLPASGGAIPDDNQSIWAPEIRGGLRQVYPVALHTGVQKGANQALIDTVAFCQQELTDLTRQHVPLEWAATQNNLGNAQSSLGERESGTATLEQAVDAYRQALKERTQQDTPQDWATTQHGLGVTLQTLGERESGTAMLEQAVDAYREALKERTQQDTPQDWATTQFSLGVALQTLGARESGAARLEQAVDAYREALKERTQQDAPQDWATTQHGLGVTLQMLGERERDAARLEQAVDAYREALKECPREHVPQYWATIQNGLGRCLAILGELESDTGKLELAVESHRKALRELDRFCVPMEWASGLKDLGNALRVLGTLEDNTAWLDQAAEAYKGALGEYQKAGDDHFIRTINVHLQDIRKLLFLAKN